MAIATASAQSNPEVKVQYLGRGEFYTGFERSGDELYATPTAVAPLGWMIVQKRTEVELEAEGKRLRAPIRFDSQGRVQFSLSAMIRELGAAGEWDKNTYYITCGIRNLSVTRNGIAVETGLPVKPKVTKMDSPDRLIVDFVGARVSPSQTFTLPEGTRVGQYQRNVFRIVVEKPGVADVDLGTLIAARRFSLDLSPVVLDGSRPAEETAPITPVGPDTQPANPLPTTNNPGAQNLASVTGARLVPQLSGDLLIVLPTSRAIGTAPSSKYIDPNTIQVSIPNTTVGITAPPALRHELLKGFAVSDDQRGSSVVMINTARPLGLRVSTAGSEVQLLLVRPKKLDPQLKSKTIVVDAGHGGKDSGAAAPGGGVYEKNITLRIARSLADELTLGGAAAVMTRSDDTYIPLNERADIANRLGADLFVSIHINSNSVDNTRSGTIIFYHKSEPLSRLLAQCIANEVARVSGLPNMGTWSDTRIYKSGFAVLRRSTMPAVLCELGFINHSTDRKRMVTEDFQSDVAKAIVKGIRVYFGDAEASQTKP